MHGHAGAHARPTRVRLAAALNLAIFAAEVAGGIAAGSLALVADAFHNLTDLSALVAVLVARRLALRPPSARHTYGLRRADVVAGLANGLVLFAAMGFVAAHALERLREPRPVAGGLMLAVGLLALAANTAGVWLLSREPVRDLGVRSAMAHLAADAASSAVVVLGAVLVRAFGWARVDPALSLVIAAFAMVGAVRLVREGVHIVMEGAPPHLSAEEVLDALRRVPGVEDVAHLHLWSLGSTEPSLTATLVVPEQPLSAARETVRHAEEALARRFGIHHTVLELEVHPREGGPPACGLNGESPEGGVKG